MRNSVKKINIGMPWKRGKTPACLERKTEREDEALCRLKERIPQAIGREAGKNSAVVIPLVKRNGEYQVLFEVRARNLKTQPGEVCFPGGRMEPGETPRKAALRELSEELLTDPGQAEIWMASDYLETPEGLTIYPFLAELKDYRGTFSRDEVEQIRLIPLSWFLEREPKRYLARVVTIPGDDFPFHLIPGGESYRWREGTYEVMFYQYGALVIWGMTARMMKACADILKREGGPLIWKQRRGQKRLLRKGGKRRRKARNGKGREKSQSRGEGNAAGKRKPKMRAVKSERGK